MSKTILLTGLSASGKSTIGKKVVDATKAVWLDGDEMREYVSYNSGFTVKDRFEHLMRMAGIACVLNNQGHDVIMSFVSPSENMRQMMKLVVGVERFRIAFCDCDYSTCAERDVKGNYKKADEGVLDDFTGYGQNYDIPKKPHFKFDTSKDASSEYADILIKELESE
jgi:adenylylsulfate kinase-like enzyme